jgi:hypothetical protein
MQKSRLIGVLAMIMVALAINVRAAFAQDDPKAFVASYMDALQKKDLYHVLGGDLPVDMQTKLLYVAEKGPIRWDVKSYKIVDSKVDGGLAVVTVEETHTKGPSDDFKSQLAMFPALNGALKWGGNTVTEKYVLVKLDGGWQFDTGHSGVPFKDFPLADLMIAVSQGKAPSDGSQQKMAEFINTIGIGQFVQTLNAYAPILVPAVTMLMEMQGTGGTGTGKPKTSANGALSGCESNLKAIAVQLELYSADHGGKYPATLHELVPKYLKAIPSCPVAKKDTYSASYKGGGATYSMCCAGHNHPEVAANMPAYDSTNGLQSAK